MCCYSSACCNNDERVNFQPLAVMLSIRGLYLLALASSVYGENLSLQYVN